MRRYYAILLALTALLVIVALLASPLPPVTLPLLAAYFCVVTGLQHWIVVRSMEKEARRFVQIFLAVTVASLFLHLAVLAFYLITHTAQARPFTVAFAIGFALYLAFETTALVLHIRKEKSRQQ